MERTSGSVGEAVESDRGILRCRADRGACGRRQHVQTGRRAIEGELCDGGCMNDRMDRARPPTSTHPRAMLMSRDGRWRRAWR